MSTVLEERTVVYPFVMEGGIEFDVRCATVHEYSKGYTVSKHSHSWVEINYINYGSCSIQVDTDYFRFKAGDCMILFPGSLHSYKVDSKTNCKMTQLEFAVRYSGRRDLLSEEVRNLQFLTALRRRRRKIFKVFKNSHVNNCMTRIYEELLNNDDFTGPLTKLYFFELIYLLSRELMQSVNENAHINDPVINPVITYIHNHINEKLSVADIAMVFKKHPNSLNNTFKRITNYTLPEYVRNIRLNEAAKLIRKDKYSFTEIANRTGFETPQYFSKVFKKTMGITPSAYKQQYGDDTKKQLDFDNDHPCCLS